MTAESRQRLHELMNEIDYQKRIARRFLVAIAIAGLLCFLGLCMTSCAAIHDRAFAVVDVSAHAIKSTITKERQLPAVETRPAIIDLKPADLRNAHGQYITPHDPVTGEVPVEMRTIWWTAHRELRGPIIKLTKP